MFIMQTMPGIRYTTVQAQAFLVSKEGLNISFSLSCKGTTPGGSLQLDLDSIVKNFKLNDFGSDWRMMTDDEIEGYLQDES